MASRLSEDSVRAVYDAGHQALLVQSDASLQLLSGGDLDLGALIDAENPEEAVQNVPALSLYQALKRNGVEDNLEILPLMSEEQVQRTFDYEAWDLDRLDALKFCQWLQLFREVSEEQLAVRFKGLEEELQLAFLSPFIEIVDEDAYEKLSGDEQDKIHRLPCNTLYFHVKTEDSRLETMIDGLVDAMLAVDLNYAYSLLAHATYVPPAEQEAQAAQFRRSRIEEDGFVSYEESLEAFHPLDLAELSTRIAKVRDGRVLPEGLVPMPDADGASPFLVATIKRGALTWTTDEYLQVVGGFAFLANTLAAAAQVETDDLGSMKRLLQQAQALSGLGLQHLSGGDLVFAAQLVRDEHPKTLFRAGLALIDALRERMIGCLETSGVEVGPAMRKLWRLHRPGALLSRLDTDVLPILGLRRTETLKGLFNRFPVRPETLTAPGEDGTPARMLFGPIGSLAALEGFEAQLGGIAGVLELAARVGQPGAALVDLDRRIGTAMARALLSEPFAAKPLTEDELRRVVELPQAAAQALTNDLFASIEGTLPAAAAQAAMEDLTDLAMRMHLAREHDKRSGGAPQALAALVDKEQNA